MMKFCLAICFIQRSFHIKIQQFCKTIIISTFRANGSITYTSLRNKKIVRKLLCKSMDWFLYDRDIRYERVSGNIFLRL